MLMFGEQIDSLYTITMLIIGISQPGRIGGDTMQTIMRVGALLLGSTLVSGCYLNDRNSEANFTASKAPYQASLSMVDPASATMAVVCADTRVWDGTLVVPPSLKQHFETECKGQPMESAAATGDGGIKDQVNRYKAIMAFNALYPTMDPRAKLARDRIQDHLMMAADAQCGDFLLAVKRASATKDGGFGMLGVLAGGVGALTTGGAWSRGMSALAGAASGANGVLDETLLKNSSLKVIESGIDMRKLEVESDIRASRKDADITYGLERALKDVVRYVEACDVVRGLSKVSDKVAAGNIDAVPDSPIAQLVSRIDKLSAAQLKTLVSLDSTVDAKKPRPSLSANPTETEVKALKTYYKGYALNATPDQQVRLMVMLKEAEKTT